MLRIATGCFTFALLGLASLHAQTVYPADAYPVANGCPDCAGPRPTATWPYGYYQTMWSRGIPYGYRQTTWTPGICPGAMPMDGYPMPAAGIPVPSSVQPAPEGEPLGVPRPLPSKN